MKLSPFSANDYYFSHLFGLALVTMTLLSQPTIGQTFDPEPNSAFIQDSVHSAPSNFYGFGMTWQRYLHVFYSTPLSQRIQFGFQFVGDFFESESPGHLPVELGFHIKSLWISNSNEDPSTNAEYAFGSISAYNNLPDQQGIRPLFSIGLGKYWRPFSNLPMGGDFSIRLGRVFFGVLRSEQNEARLTQFSARFSLFFLTEKTLFWF